MKKFKHILVSFMCLVCMFSLCACGKTPEEATTKNLTNVTKQLEKSISKLQFSNASDLASLAISPELDKVELSNKPAKFYKSDLSEKVKTTGERVNLENYIVKLEEIYKLNLEILNKNEAINKARVEIAEKLTKVKEEVTNIKRGLKKVSKTEEESINTCVKALRRTAENLDNKKQYFNSAKSKFVNADLNKPEATLVNGNTLLAEMDNVFVDLNFTSSVLENLLVMLNNLSLIE